MKPLYLALALLAGSALSGGTSAQEGSLFGREKPERLPEGTEVLAAMRAALPAQPLRIAGQLTVFDAAGEAVRAVETELDLRWGETPPQARFIVRDAFGSELARLDVVRPAGQPPLYRYVEGDPPRPVEAPGPSNRIAGTDFAWADLSLDFLWWPGGKTIRSEMKKGRLCHVVDLPVPEGRGEGSMLRLWVDAHAHALLQGDACGPDGRVLRRLAVTRLQKIDGEWTLKDFEVVDRLSGRKTVFRVRSVQGEGVEKAQDEEMPPVATAPEPRP